jgi:DNA-binding CsgD family transcriptional regulator
MAESVRLMGRNGRIWRDYVRGKTQEDIAQKYDLDQSTVSNAIANVRDSIPVLEREALVKEEIDLFRHLRDQVLELWDADAPNLVSNGREIKGIKDHGGRLAALARAESLSARLHRITGIEATQKVDLTLQGEEEAARRQAAEAVTYLHGGDDA